MRTNIHRRGLLGTTAVLLVCGATAGTAFAAASSDGIEEIVVTAQKRAERLQDVPASITALSENQLAARGVTNTIDLAQSTPGLTFGTTGPWTNFYMRGVGNSYNTPSAQSPVAMYVDGVYQADVSSVAFGLSDVERVELLKGPQGTLYGRNAVGGAINVITKMPTQTLEAKLQVSGGNYGNQEYSGYVSGGTEKVQANLAVDRHLRDGYYKNITPGAQDLDNIDDLMVRGKLRFEPTERLDLILGLDYSEQKGRGPATTSLPIDPVNPQAFLGGVFPTAQLFGGVIPTEPWRTSQTSDLSSDAQNKGVSLTGRYHFETFDVVSITAARDFDDKHGVDMTASNLDLANWRAHDFHQQISQELQILSTEAARFSWIAGLYYLHDDAGFEPFHLNSFAHFNGVFVDINSKVRGDSYAAFAEGTYKVTDEFSIVAGLRYSWDEETHYLAHETVTLGAAPVTLADFDSSGNSHSWYALTPRISLNYKRPEGLYYITASKGYSAGLYNVATIAPLESLDIPVKPQKIKAVEIGAKWQFLDNRLQVNLAGFYYDLKNLQIMQIAGGGLTAFENADGESKGIDLDTRWAATSNLTLRAAGELLDARYSSYPQASIFVPNLQQGNMFVAPCGGQPGATPFDASCKALANLTGKPMMRSPRFTSTLGVDWRIPFLPEQYGSMVLTGNWYHSGSFWTTANGSIVSPAYDSLDGNLSYVFPNGEWQASLWVNNLTDAKYLITGGEVNYARQIMLAPPQTFGITVTYHFGG